MGRVRLHPWPGSRIGIAAALIAACALALPATAAADGKVSFNSKTRTTTVVDGRSSLDFFVTLESCLVDGEPATCDSFSTGFFSDSTLHPGANCDLSNGSVICPQANDYVMSLGGGADEVSWGNPLYYETFTVSSGPGDDVINGATRKPKGWADRMIVSTGAGEDEVDGGPGRDVLRGGPGNDNLFGAGGRDRILGQGAGDFYLNGGPGRDKVSGGGGNDNLGFRDELTTDLDAGADVYSGGRGRDEMIYGSNRNSGVRVSLDNRANDGSGRERDNVKADVEDVLGTSHRDVLIGSRKSNELEANEGGDKLVGRGGFDSLDGEDGNDVIRARGGGRDAVDCGEGGDLAVVDKGDLVIFEPPSLCEAVRRR